MIFPGLGNRMKLTSPQVQRRSPTRFPGLDEPRQQVYAPGPARSHRPSNRQRRPGRSCYHLVAAEGHLVTAEERLDPQPADSETS